jgi:hypothetical protein
MRKAHGDVKDDQGTVLFAYSQPGDNYMGSREDKSLLVRSNIVRNCLNPTWQEVEVDLGR